MYSSGRTKRRQKRECVDVERARERGEREGEFKTRVLCRVHSWFEGRRGWI